MKKIFYSSLFSILCLAACTAEAPVSTDTPEDILPEQPVSEVTVLHAGFSDPTRTCLQEGGKVYWSPGDEIRLLQVRNSGSEWETGGSRFVTTLTAPAPTADFIGTLPVAEFGDEDAESRYWAVYPYSAANTMARWDILYIDLPAVQTGRAGTFPDGISPAFACTEDPTELSFQHPLSGIQLSFDTPGIAHVYFMASDGLSINGDFGVYYDDDDGQIVSSGYTSYSDPDMLYRSVVELVPEDGGTFQTGQPYYIILPPVPMDEGFSLLLEKADGSYTTRKITKSVEFHRATFRTLPQTDKGLSWKAPGVSLDAPSADVPWYGNIFTVTANCTKSYTVEADCDWITEVTAADEERIRTLYSMTIGGDSRFDGCIHGFLCKANPGAERSATITFSDGSTSQTFTVTQASGSHIPAITRHHLGTCVDTYGGRNPIYNWFFNNAMEATDFGEAFNFYSIFSTSSSSDCIKEGMNTGFATQMHAWGSMDGRIKFTTRDNYDEFWTLMQETDDYYLPLTSIGVTTTLDEENRKVTADVTLYAAKAGTYKMLGAVIDKSVYYNIGILYSHDIYHLVRKPLFTSTYGDQIVFDTDGSTKTFSYTIDLPDEFSGAAGTWGQRKNQFILFAVKAQYEDQVRISNEGEYNWYFDNCRWLGFDSTAPLEVAGL